MWPVFVLATLGIAAQAAATAPHIANPAYAHTDLLPMLSALAPMGAFPPRRGVAWHLFCWHVTSASLLLVWWRRWRQFCVFFSNVCPRQQLQVSICEAGFGRAHNIAPLQVYATWGIRCAPEVQRSHHFIVTQMPDISLLDNIDIMPCCHIGCGFIAVDMEDGSLYAVAAIMFCFLPKV